MDVIENIQNSADDQIAYTETERVNEVDETLVTLLNALHRVQLTETLPDEIPQLDNTQCAALKLCTAIIEYLDVAIKTLRRPFVGKNFMALVLC
jgi:hypothetical protein